MFIAAEGTVSKSPIGYFRKIVVWNWLPIVDCCYGSETVTFAAPHICTVLYTLLPQMH
jgi:hypothetical protein